MNSLKYVQMSDYWVSKADMHSAAMRGAAGV